MSRSPNTTTAPTGNIAPFGLRMLPELKEKLEESAKAAGRSMNAEIVARLQQSFDLEPMKEEKREELLKLVNDAIDERSGLEVIASELDQQRALAEQFRSIADSTDSLRTLLAAMLLRAFEKMRDSGIPVDADVWLQETLLMWLTEKDIRGAAFSVLRLIDGSNPEIIETLRNFAGHLEDLGLVNKPIKILMDGPRSKKERLGASVNKVILVGNIGRDPEVNYLPQTQTKPIQAIGTAARTKTSKPPKTLGPALKKR